MKKKALLVLLVAFLAPLDAKENSCSPDFQLTSDQVESLFYPIWAHFVETKDGWWIVPNQGAQEIPIYRFQPEKGVQEVFSGDARYGLRFVYGAAEDEAGNLFIKGVFSPTVYKFSSEDQSFDSFCEMTGGLGPIHYIDGDLIAANNNLEIIGCGSMPTWAERLNKALPDSRMHHMVGISNIHQLRIAQLNMGLVIGTTMNATLYWFPDKQKNDNFLSPKIRFKGYQEPEPKVSDRARSTPEALNRELANYHLLQKLSTRNGVVYGWFQRGHEAETYWVNLVPKSSQPFFYANQDQPDKIFAIGETSVLMGHYHEGNSGLKVCLQMFPNLPKGE